MKVWRVASSLKEQFLHDAGVEMSTSSTLKRRFLEIALAIDVCRQALTDNDVPRKSSHHGDDRTQTQYPWTPC